MDKNQGYEIIKAVMLENGRGFALGYSVMLCGRFYIPAPWDNLSQGSQPRLPISAVPPFCSPTHT